MSSQPTYLNHALYEYLLKHSVHEHAVMQELRRYTAKLPQHKMQISPDQAQFMYLLAKIHNVRKAVEIGVFTGYSTLALALAMPEDGCIIACDVDEVTTTAAQNFWQQAGVQHKISLKLAPALETLQNLIANKQQNQFDWIFIDADKQNYMDYYEQALILTRPGGLILIDNVFWNGDVVELKTANATTQALQKLNDKIYQDQRVEMCMLAIGDGLTIARKRE